MEEWKEIADFEGLYLISSFGRVKSIINNKILTPCIVRANGLVVGLMRNGKVEKRQVSRLVAAAFIPNPENKPCIDHIDGDRANNHADNLRWVTVKENQNNPITKSKWIGKKAKPHHEKAVEQIKNGIVVNVFVSIQEAARKGNFSATAICKVCKGKGNLHKGYKWRYKK